MSHTWVKKFYNNFEYQQSLKSSGNYKHFSHKQRLEQIEVSQTFHIQLTACCSHMFQPNNFQLFHNPRPQDLFPTTIAQPNIHVHRYGIQHSKFPLPLVHQTQKVSKNYKGQALLQLMSLALLNMWAHISSGTTITCSLILKPITKSLISFKPLYTNYNFITEKDASVVRA